MTENIRVQYHITRIVIGISVLAWVLMLMGHRSGDEYGNALYGGMCISPTRAATGFFDSLFTINIDLLPAHLVNWLIMLFAMMAPTLIAPLQHIWERSFKRNRIRAMSIFALGYTLVWMAMGVVIWVVSSALMSIFLSYPLFPILMVLLIALIWQCAPIKQRCLNRMHNHSALRAFGLAANIDAFQFGLRHGFWCVGSCWALMTFPMMLTQGHFFAMSLVTFIMVSDSLERPTLPQWRFRMPEKLFLLLKGHSRIYMGRRLIKDL